MTEPIDPSPKSFFKDLRAKRIVLAGGSGFVGRMLAEAFCQAGSEVTILSRTMPRGMGDVKRVLWDGRTVGDWVSAMDDCDAVVNLAGRTVDCIKTPDHCDEILRSRVESTRVLGLAMRRVTSPPPVWIQMSTAHRYGDPPSVVCTEDSADGYGLAPTVARAWESAFSESRLPGQRGVVMRTSFVIGRNRGSGGGAMTKLGWITRWGLGGRVGKGTQGISWIHEDDLCAIFAKAIVDQAMSGAYIVSAPHPIAQVEFMQTLRKVLGMPIGLPAFAWMVRLGAPMFFRTDPELVLYGRRVLPRRLLDSGFSFTFAELEPALRDWYARSR